MSLDPKLTRIGVHTVPDCTITFLAKPHTPSLSPGAVVAIINTDTEELPVDLPPMHVQSETKTLTFVEKVLFFLQNCNFYPVYKPDQKRVSFENIESENKAWEIFREIGLPPEITRNRTLILRADDRMSYFFVNTVTTWDWRNDSCSVVSLDTKITALAEHTTDGSLLIGDNKGRLRCKNEWLQVLEENPISSIVLLNSRYCILNEQILFDITSGKIIKTFEDCQCLTQHFIVVQQTKETKLLKINMDLEGIKFEDHTDKIILEEKTVQKIKALPDGTLFIAYNDSETMALFNTENLKSSKVWKDEKNYKEISSKTTLLKMNDDTLVFGDGSSNKAYVNFYSIPKKDFSFHDVGSWSVTALTQLSDGSLMVGTDTTFSGIHVVSQTGKRTFSTRGKDSNDFVNNGQIRAIKELPNGFVLVQFSDSLIVIRPKLDYKLLNPDKQYQIYLAGLQAAIKNEDVYQARKCYEKAKALKPEETELYELFLSLLKNSPHKKQETQVLLDLHKITKKIPEEINPGKTCKTRLFIGEHDFSYTKALLEKHQKTHKKLASVITATELAPPIEDESTWKRIETLMEKGVRVLFGIDATQLHKTFKNQRFQRIQWNGPFGGTSDNAKKRFKKVIPQFFLSCAQIQMTGDRVHVTLAEGNAYRQAENPIVLGATNAGYRLIRKRKFGATRYPGYAYLKTGSAEKTGFTQKEFVFERITAVYAAEKTFLENAQKLENPKEKEFSVKEDPKSEDYYYVCSSDEDSSDYYDSESEISDAPELSLKLEKMEI